MNLFSLFSKSFSYSYIFSNLCMILFSLHLYYFGACWVYVLHHNWESDCLKYFVTFTVFSAPKAQVAYLLRQFFLPSNRSLLLSSIFLFFLLFFRLGNIYWPAIKFTESLSLLFMLVIFSDLLFHFITFAALECSFNILNFHFFLLRTPLIYFYYYIFLFNFLFIFFLSS